MNILIALKQEEAKLRRQLEGIQGAIRALSGRASGIQPPTKVVGHAKRVMSAAARAKISRATKARWAKFRAEKSKKGKSKSKTIQ
jgi:hypothetical protein